MSTSDLVTSSTAQTAVQQSSTARKSWDGILGGLAGGVVFGVMMAMQGMLPMVGMLIGQSNTFVGFAVHMAISAFIGATFGLLLGRMSTNLVRSLIWGAAYGLVWWVLGALILMPAMLGMNEMIFQVGQMQWMSLIGHAIFGLVMGATYYGFSRRRS